MGLLKGNFSNALEKKFQAAGPAVCNALRTTRSTCLPVLVINVNWTAPTFEEDRCVDAFARPPQRALNSSTSRVIYSRTHKLFPFPWDRRCESPGSIHQTRRSRAYFPRGE